MECTVKWIDGRDEFRCRDRQRARLRDGRRARSRRAQSRRRGRWRRYSPEPAACTAYDVVLILKRSGQDVTGCEVDVKAERAETDPKVFTKIHMHFVVRGRDLKPPWSKARSS